MGDVLFGVVRAERVRAAPVGLLGAAAMDDRPHRLCGSFSRTMIFNFGAAITSRAAHG
jgi:hypothetical protein